jgi:hypothetical protein
MPPLMAPIVQLKILGTVAFRGIFGLVALQIVTFPGARTPGTGLTVTVIGYIAPMHDPVIGVTPYVTVPATALLGLIKVCMIAVPAPMLAPVIPPVVPRTVQVQIPGVLVVRLIFVVDPLQTVLVLAVVTDGTGLTVTVIGYTGPTHPPVLRVGVTRYCTSPDVKFPGLVKIWLIAVPEPAL